MIDECFCKDCVRERGEEKPPLGLRPKYIVAELRLQEIAEAICRFTEARYPIPNEWIEEWNELLTSKKRR